MYVYTNIFKWRCTRCARVQTNQRSYIKRLNITYNTGLEPALGWGAEERRGMRKECHLETMYTICDGQERKASV